jgi:hypothetical protein
MLIMSRYMKAVPGKKSPAPGKGRGKGGKKSRTRGREIGNFYFSRGV